MQSAEDIFRDFFGGRDPFASFFDDDDDFFGGGLFGGGFNKQKSKGSRRDPFGMGGFGMFEDDDFFGGGIG
jgi:DnaJ family protein B protein 6